MNRMTIYAIAAGAFTLAAVGGVFVYTLATPKSDDQFAACRTSAIAGGTAQIGGPFTLVDENGKTVTDKDVITKPSLLYFGYTFCPDVCPLDNSRNADAISILNERGYDVQPVFITVDPERDTPEVMKEFTDLFSPDMLGLTGTPEQIKAASQAYRTFYQKQSGDPEYYLVNHSTFSYLTVPDLGFVDFFRRDLTAEQLADKMACYLDAM